jgi:hypothetical protein
MRYNEFSLTPASTLEEALLDEAFLNDLAKTVGNKAMGQIAVVNNAATAAQVLYKVCSNAQYLETATFELKRAIKTKLKTMPDGKLKSAIVSKFPQGRGIKDFFAAMALISVINTVSLTKGMVQDQAVSNIIDSVVNLDALIGQLLSAGVGGLGMVFKALGVGNAVLFSVLTAINKKIEGN